MKTKDAERFPQIYMQIKKILSRKHFQVAGHIQSHIQVAGHIQTLPSHIEQYKCHSRSGTFVVFVLYHLSVENYSF